MTFAPYARRHGVSHRRRRGDRRLSPTEPAMPMISAVNDG
jgi:hypothetical protein